MASLKNTTVQTIATQLNTESFINNEVKCLLNELTTELTHNVNEYKINRMREALEAHNINADVLNELGHRFSPFKMEVKNGCETIYYNDGSIDGLKLVSFRVDNDKPLNFDNHHSTISLNIEYVIH